MQVPIKIMEFIKDTRSGVLAVSISNEKIHGAAILYVSDQENNNFYYATELVSEKCTLIRNGVKNIPASFVIGTEPGTPYSIQLDGVFNIVVDSAEKKEFVSELIRKQGEKHWNDNYVLVKFTPLKGKYTDYSSGWDKHEITFNESH